MIEPPAIEAVSKPFICFTIRIKLEGFPGNVQEIEKKRKTNDNR